MVVATGYAMQRLTISVNKQLALSFDELIKRKGYRNRSEAFRHLLRKTLQQEPAVSHVTSRCVGCLNYAYDIQKSQVVSRLAEVKQRFLNITISSTLTAFDQSVCIETLILRGSSEQIAAFANAVSGEAGVTSGQLNLVPINTADSQDPVEMAR
jgi:CopG family transcriptional regulator, nickel-responsive regulator